MPKISRTETVDALIIGAGWSGLYAAKYAKAEGLTVKILEARSDIGGVWNYSPSKDLITVMRDTISSSSRHVTEASDFPMSQDAGNFMRHQDVIDYLKTYAGHFNLSQDIEFSSQVASADKHENGKWEVITTNGEKYYSTNLVICTGVHQTKRKIDGPVSAFGGEIYHAGDFKHFDNFDVSETDHVVVYGGGETASDIIDQLVQKPCKITWAIRGGQHFFRKAPLRSSQDIGEYDRWDNALDTQSTFIHSLFTNASKSKPGMRYGCNIASSGSVFSYQGHGIKEWQNEIPWYHAFFNKNGHTLDYVWSKRVNPASEIVSCQGTNIHFSNGKTIQATHIICCFGYEPIHTFLPQWVNQQSTHLLYKLVFHPDDPSLSFIGYARPTILSIPFMAEVQCMWASQIWAGKKSLPSSQKMEEVVKVDLKERENYFPIYTNKNIVDPILYVLDISRLLGIRLVNQSLVKDPTLWLKALAIPFSPLSTRILLGRYSKEDVKRVDEYVFPHVYLKKIGNNSLSGLNLINEFFRYFFLMFATIGLTRFFRVDALFDWIAKIKISKQGRSMTRVNELEAIKSKDKSLIYVDKLATVLDSFFVGFFRTFLKGVD